MRPRVQHAPIVLIVLIAPNAAIALTGRRVPNVVHAAPARPTLTTTRRSLEPRKPTRAEFAAMLALLSGAGDSVRADLLKQVPDGNASLIDSLLAGDDEALSRRSKPKGSPAASAMRPTRSGMAF